MNNLSSSYGFRDDFNWETRLDLKTKTNGYLISTVDLGIDHSFGYGDPLWYETMVFPINEEDGTDFCEVYMKRYTTEEEAREGHKKTIEMVKKGEIKYE